MPLLKRKPVVPTPLPPVSSILQPLPISAQAQTASSPSADSPIPPASEPNMPQDGKDDEEQLDRLLSVVRGEMGGVAAIQRGGKRAGHHRQSLTANGALPTPYGDGTGVNGAANGEKNATWKIWDRECFYLPETGEIFTDYESYCARRTFYEQPLFQCEVSSKSGLSYFTALASEQRETRQLHTRFPRQLKKAALSACQFHIEGKLETLADKIFERFENRFCEDEKVFVDVQGDKYLARIVKIFPPKNLIPPIHHHLSPSPPLRVHPYAVDLSLEPEEVIERDDPMKYFYIVRLIEEGAEEGVAAEYASSGQNGIEDADGEGEKWEGSTMEVQADKLSRDRMNFSRTMLKRFIRDCVHRESAVYSPWLVKPSVAKRYGIPNEMSEEVREAIVRFRERQMDKRKRDRDERLGINAAAATGSEGGVEEEEQVVKKKKSKKVVEEEVKVEEEEVRKKKPMKYPADDLVVEWSDKIDEAAGRPLVRPTPNRTLPFGDQFETLLMTWSFLNVMGKPLALSPFTLDDYEQALYHNDPWTSPTPLMTEIHACLINALVRDLAARHEAVQHTANTGRLPDNDTDYWEGKKGATTDLLRPIAEPWAESWKLKELSHRDNRKGWEVALVGLLWDRATLETLPNYLDNILDMTFEDKPAPTRPTWSTGPTQTQGHGLIPSRPEKRYSLLHHLHKLEIIQFLVELVSQTEAVRDFMEESTAALTEVRKVQVEVKRDYKKALADIELLEPKKPKVEEAVEGEDADGDVSMNVAKEERLSPDIDIDSSIRGFANGNGLHDGATNTERDELDDSISNSSDTNDHDESGLNQTAASRRRAMKEKAAEREAEQAVRLAAAQKERDDARVKKTETKILAAEKKRLTEECEAAIIKLRALEHEFRSHMYTLRARPFGLDRFGNKLWWMDGLGSSPLTGENGRVMWGTGRLYLQGVDDADLEYLRLHVVVAGEEIVVEKEELEARRKAEEGDGRLGPGQWGSYETPEQLEAFISWLNPRGTRETHLLKSMKAWLPEIEGGMRRRRIAAGLEQGQGEDEVVKRNRPLRKVVAAGGGGTHGDEGEGVGYQGWRVSLLSIIVKYDADSRLFLFFLSFSSIQ
ncbi:hypothetical protein BCR39DRAFT_100098 [Naematelia encephala]|uniref:ATP-utilizing chromatin assembly and remodelling N-terminal-domain-containing protein n=1 Tax=Naematelia encephala TaxID=71784 RepID=A0A1Y2B837_9TREE|nr:hypothetical protein BCR39DRAFT_100098 [Naematelia encephala]